MGGGGGAGGALVWNPFENKSSNLRFVQVAL